MLPFKSYVEERESFFNGSVSCQERVERFLAQIEKKRHLNIFLEVWGEEALERARQVDEKIRNGTAGKLAGMVIALKDNLCYKGHQVSAASQILKGFTSLFSGTAVQRLLDEDAIFIGRANCDEFAMGSSNENSSYGPVLNPLDETRVPGGSSGGSAAAVAAGLCHAALGSDTGGSIRQPASFCGIVGFRPTYGRISRHGLLAFASSMDQIGPLTLNVEDTALLTEVMSGKDEYDATVSSREVPPYSQMLAADEKFSFTYLEDCIDGEGIDPEIRSRTRDIITQLESEGISSNASTFPYADQVVPVYYVLATAEASSNLERYAGMVYGHRSPHAENLEQVITKSRSEAFGPEVKRRIMLGTFVLSEGYYDAYFAKGQKVRKLIQDHAYHLLRDKDFIVLPTSPTTAFHLGDRTADPIAMYLADIYTIQAALAGIPAISLPLGWHSNGMPFGVQVMGRPFEEEKLLAFSHKLMKLFSTGK